MQQTVVLPTIRRICTSFIAPQTTIHTKYWIQFQYGKGCKQSIIASQIHFETDARLDLSHLWMCKILRRKYSLNSESDGCWMVISLWLEEEEAYFNCIEKLFLRKKKWLKRRAISFKCQLLTANCNAPKKRLHACLIFTSLLTFQAAL